MVSVLLINVSWQPALGTTCAMTSESFHKYSNALRKKFVFILGGGADLNFFGYPFFIVIWVIGNP